jgi:nucleotide-binding universal stress UspA family protein
MFEKILVPVDFSDYTDQILDVVLEISRKFNSEIHLLHIIPTMDYLTPYESFLAVDNLVEVQKQIEQDVEKDLEKVGQKLPVSTVKAIRSGVAFMEIIDYVKTQNIELVIMGTHGRGALEHILMGGVAEKVVRRAPCPVLTIRPKGRTAGHHH